MKLEFKSPKRKVPKSYFVKLEFQCPQCTYCFLLNNSTTKKLAKDVPKFR